MKRKKIENYILQLNKELGQGSFGKVYFATKEVTKDEVAVKVIAKQAINEDEYVKEALVSEIRVMRQLHSRCIVSLKDVLETSNNYYIVQEYCNGGNLRAYMKKKKKLPEKEAINIMGQICEGFLELIDHGVIHRDVKPENILIHDDLFKLADFGFAKNVKSAGQLNKSMVGTPLYMSPQILKMEKYSSKCDIWALGVLFYEMIVGETPWPARTEFELLTNIETKAIIFPPKAQISNEAKDLIIGCLRNSQNDRFSWKEVYSHPIFGNKFQQFIDVTEQLEKKAQYILNQLRVKIHYQNLDLQKLFKKFKLDKTSNIKLTQLIQLLRTFDNDIEAKQAKYIFQVLDTDKNGTIELEEFKEYLSKNGVRMEAFVPMQASYVKSQGQSPEQTTQTKRIRETILKLKKKVDQYKLDLHDIYKVYDKNNDKSLSAKEFNSLICKIDKSLTDEQCKVCFKFFDINGDSKICYDEFLRTICKITGEVYQKSTNV